MVISTLRTLFGCALLVMPGCERQQHHLCMRGALAVGSVRTRCKPLQRGVTTGSISDHIFIRTWGDLFSSRRYDIETKQVVDYSRQPHCSGGTIETAASGLRLLGGIPGEEIMADLRENLPGLVVDDEEIPVAPNLVTVPPTASPADCASPTDLGVICW